MGRLLNGEKIYLAYGLSYRFETYKVETLEEAEESPAIENFIDWLEDREIEVSTMEELNKAFYVYYECDDYSGFAKAFEDEDEASAYLEEVRRDTEGRIEEGIF